MLTLALISEIVLIVAFYKIRYGRIKSNVTTFNNLNNF